MVSGKPDQCGGVATGQRFVEGVLDGDRVRVVAAGRRRGEGVRAVGDDEHADRVGGLVDFAAQLPAPAQRRVDTVIVGIYPHLGVCLRVGLPAHPAGDQRAERQLARHAVVR